MRILRNQTLWGTAALVFVAVVGLVAALLYVSPPGQKTVVFYTEDAASIREGDPVRIAGIDVGKVQHLSLEKRQVRVEARIKDSAFVGEQSQVEVRMLTVVGGYYVNVLSLGSTPLGSKPIPLERVTMPYSLIRTLTDATKITDNVKPKPINESLDQLQSGLAGTNTESLTAIINAGNSLMSTVDRQRGQVTNILNISDEYIQSLNGFSENLKGLIRKASIVEQTLILYAEGFNTGLTGLGDILDSLEPVSNFYLNHRERFLELVRRWQVKAREWVERDGAIVRSIRLMRNKFERVLDAQNAPPELLATDMCMPIPGSPC